MIQWDKFYPTVYEVELAKKIFFKSLSENYLDCKNGVISEKIAISTAIAEVWTAGKKYQDKHSRALKENEYCERPKLDNNSLLSSK